MPKAKAPTKKSGLESLDVSIAKGSQSLNYSELGILHGAKVKLDIKSDSYSQQCHAQLFVWSNADMKWNLVSSIHPGAMATGTGHHHRSEFAKAVSQAHAAPLFEQDRSTLIRMAALVLGE